MSKKWSTERHAWFIDERDGLRKKLRNQRKDGYTPGLKVGRDTYDPPEPQEKPIRDINDPQSLKHGTGDVDRAAQVLQVSLRELTDGVGPLGPPIRITIKPIITLTNAVDQYHVNRITVDSDDRITTDSDNRVVNAGRPFS